MLYTMFIMSYILTYMTVQKYTTSSNDACNYMWKFMDSNNTSHYIRLYILVWLMTYITYCILVATLLLIPILLQYFMF